MKKQKAIELLCPLPGAKAFKCGDCMAIVARENGRWHMSISCKDRLPSWEEVRDARYELTPHNTTMIMVLPKPEQYVNLHPYCFHLWETNDKVPGEWG